MINIKLKKCCDYCNDAQIKVSNMFLRTGYGEVLECNITCRHANVCFKLKEETEILSVHEDANYDVYAKINISQTR